MSEKDDDLEEKFFEMVPELDVVTVVVQEDGSLEIDYDVSDYEALGILRTAMRLVESNCVGGWVEIASDDDEK